MRGHSYLIATPSCRLVEFSALGDSNTGGVFILDDRAESRNVSHCHACHTETCQDGPRRTGPSRAIARLPCRALPSRAKPNLDTPATPILA